MQTIGSNEVLVVIVVVTLLAALWMTPWALRRRGSNGAAAAHPREALDPDYTEERMWQESEAGRSMTLG